MNTYFTSSCFLLAVFGFGKAINYEKCGSGKGAVTIRKLSLDPDPVVLSRNSLKISAAVEVFEDINNMIVETKIWKITWALFGIKIYIRAPCVIGEGKCYMEFCKLLKSFNAECMKDPTGIFTVEDTTVYLPDLSGTARWFASGYFYIEMRLFDKNTHAEKGCYIITGQAHP